MVPRSQKIAVQLFDIQLEQRFAIGKGFDILIRLRQKQERLISNNYTSSNT